MHYTLDDMKFDEWLIGGDGSSSHGWWHLGRCIWWANPTCI